MDLHDQGLEFDLRVIHARQRRRLLFGLAGFGSLGFWRAVAATTRLQPRSARRRLRRPRLRRPPVLSFRRKRQDRILLMALTARADPLRTRWRLPASSAATFARASRAHPVWLPACR